MCELAGVLGSVKAHRGALANAGAIRHRLHHVDSLLARLPGSGAGIKKMSNSVGQAAVFEDALAKPLQSQAHCRCKEIKWTR